jgi:hypothetical protein
MTILTVTVGPDSAQPIVTEGPIAGADGNVISNAASPQPASAHTQVVDIATPVEAQQ